MELPLFGDFECACVALVDLKHLIVYRGVCSCDPERVERMRVFDSPAAFDPGNQSLKYCHILPALVQSSLEVDESACSSEKTIRLAGVLRSETIQFSQGVAVM